MRRGAIVLCGGRSRRMGRDKAGLLLAGEPMLSRVLRRLLPLVSEVVAVARPGQTLPPLPERVQVIRDAVADQGPLRGIQGGLSALDVDAAYATACDVPFLVPGVVELLFARLGEHDVAVAEAEGFLHPLAAVYRPRVAEAAAALLAEGHARPVALYERVPTERVGEAELRAVDPDLDTLMNLNTPEAYEAAARRAETETA